MLKLAASYVQPIFWLSGPMGSGPIRSGTTFFLDAGHGVFGITAGHVLDSYRNQTKGRTAVCHVGMRGLNLDLEARLISRGSRIDIATYRIEPDEVAQLGATIGREPSWPPERPQGPRGGVFYAGYPGKARNFLGERTIEWGLYGACGISTVVNENSIVCQIERQNLVQALGLPLPEVGYDVGGLSGAPLFAFWQSTTIVHWKLAGVIYEGGGELFEHVRAAHADRIRADGTIED